MFYVCEVSFVIIFITKWSRRGPNICITRSCTTGTLSPDMYGARSSYCPKRNDYACVSHFPPRFTTCCRTNWNGFVVNLQFGLVWYATRFRIEKQSSARRSRATRTTVSSVTWMLVRTVWRAKHLRLLHRKNTIQFLHLDPVSVCDFFFFYEMVAIKMLWWISLCVISFTMCIWLIFFMVGKSWAQARLHCKHNQPRIL